MRAFVRSFVADPTNIFRSLRNISSLLLLTIFHLRSIFGRGRTIYFVPPLSVCLSVCRAPTLFFFFFSQSFFVAFAFFSIDLLLDRQARQAAAKVCTEKLDILTHAPTYEDTVAFSEAQICRLNASLGNLVSRMYLTERLSVWLAGCIIKTGMSDPLTSTSSTTQNGGQPHPKERLE